MGKRKRNLDHVDEDDRGPEVSEERQGGEEEEEDHEEEEILVVERLGDHRQETDGDRSYVVEAVVGSKHFDGKVYYLLKWKGWHSSSNTWESSRNMTNCMPKVRSFNKTVLEDLPKKKREKIDVCDFFDDGNEGDSYMGSRYLLKGTHDVNEYEGVTENFRTDEEEDDEEEEVERSALLIEKLKIAARKATDVSEGDDDVEANDEDDEADDEDEEEEEEEEEDPPEGAGNEETDDDGDDDEIADDIIEALESKSRIISHGGSDEDDDDDDEGEGEEEDDEEDGEEALEEEEDEEEEATDDRVVNDGDGPESETEVITDSEDAQEAQDDFAWYWGLWGRDRPPTLPAVRGPARPRWFRASRVPERIVAVHRTAPEFDVIYTMKFVGSSYLYNIAGVDAERVYPETVIHFYKSRYTYSEVNHEELKQAGKMRNF